MYTAGQLNLVSRWDAAMQTYNTCFVAMEDPLLILGDFQLNPGDGMWAWVKMTGVLAYEPLP